MTLPQRVPPGPTKRFERYFTVPISQAIHEGLEKIKWRLRLDKTEVVRRFIDYILTLPPEAQDKLLLSFQQQKEEEAKKTQRRAKKVKVKKEDVPTYKMQTQEVLMTPKNPFDLKPKPEAPVVPRVIKRSGLP